MIYKCRNAYYFRNINKIGGIESHFFYIAKKYAADYEIVFFYQTGDENQIRRIRRYARCVKITGNDRVICDKLFCCFNREILNQCQAGTKYLVLHGDYLDMVRRGQLDKKNLPMDDRIDRYIGISRHVCEGWHELTGIEAECIYEPVENEKNDCLIFASATRLTQEKGWERMIRLAEMLDQDGINYLWFIFTDSKKEPLKNMCFIDPRLDIADKMSCFDAFIQLSDNEGYCLSVVEALRNGVPVICTDLPVFSELGLNRENSVKISLDMKDVPLEEIGNIRKKKFIYHEPEDRWHELFEKGKDNTMTRIKALVSYYDTFENLQVAKDDIYETTEDRAELICNAGYAEKIEVKVKKEKSAKKTK